MINTENISDELRDTLNLFTENCRNCDIVLKNGNSLKMELELELYNKAGKNIFFQNLDLIHKRISNILNNIQVKK